MENRSPFTPSVTLILDKVQVRRAVSLMCDFQVKICMKVDAFNENELSTVAIIGDIETVTKFISNLYGN